VNKGFITTAAGVCLLLICAYLGYHAAELKYEKQIAEMERAQAIALKEAQESHAAGLAKATDTILLASSEYDALRGDLDSYRARLRDANRRRSAEGNSADALNARVTELEKLVQRLVDAGSECGRHYQRSAANHDALAEILK
jgi:chromosome segregation ATPase